MNKMFLHVICLFTCSLSCVLCDCPPGWVEAADFGIEYEPGGQELGKC